MISKWDRRYLDLAWLVSSWSKDPSTKTGAVITKNNKIISLGFNGFARGIDDSVDRLNDRDIKYKMIVHCERNAMLFAAQDLTGCTLYTVPFMSCAPCAAMVIQAGFKRCVAPYSENPRWQEDFKLTSSMFKEAGVDLDIDWGEEKQNDNCSLSKLSVLITHQPKSNLV